MAEYMSKDIFKQLQEVMNKCDKLTIKVEQQERHIKVLEEDNERLRNKCKKLESKILELNEENANLKNEMKELTKENEILKNDNDRLKGITSKDSTNSSIPPSQDTKSHKVNLREKSNKKIGAQKKHKGTTLTQKDIDNLIDKNKAIKRVKIHGNPKNKICIIKSIVDIETKVIVTEHRFYFEKKRDIQIPLKYKSNVQYGENIKNLCNLLVIEDTISLERVNDLIKILTKEALNISQGSIINWITQKSEQCEKIINGIKEKIKNTEKVYTDLTTTSLSGKYTYVRNYSDEKYTLYEPSKDKTIETIREHNILNNYTGYIIHDHETSLYNFGLKEKHVECNVHLRRYLKYNTEINLKNTWSKQMDELLIKIKRDKEKLILENTKSFSKEYLENIDEKYDSILDLGFKENKNNNSKVLKKEEKALLNRLKKYKTHHLSFAYDFNVPFDNNLSERDLRKIKTKKKISGCFRSERLLKAYCRIQTVISSCKKQKLNVFEILKSIGVNRVSL